MAGGIGERCESSADQCFLIGLIALAAIAVLFAYEIILSCRSALSDPHQARSPKRPTSSALTMKIAALLVGGRDADHINWLEQRYGWSQGAIPLPRGWQLERKRRGLCGNDRAKAAMAQRRLT